MSIKKIRKRFDPYVKPLGWLLTLGCCLYVAKELQREKETLELLSSRLDLLTATLLFSVSYILVNIGIGAGWNQFSKGFSDKSFLNQSIKLSLKVQIAKYLPGNVFHLAGRVLIGERIGIRKRHSSAATLLENLTVALVALSISSPLILENQQFKFVLIPLCLVFGLILLTIVFTTIREKLSDTGLNRYTHRSSFTLLLGSIAFYLPIFIAPLFYVYCMHRVVPFETEPQLLPTLQILAISWLAGFVVIGAPGGIGVREATLLAFGKELFLPSELALMMIVLRATSIIGDLLSFILITILSYLQQANE